MSETKKSELVAALIAAQRDFAPAVKSKVNPHFRSKYVDLAGAMEATQEALWKNGLTVVQMTETTADHFATLITRLEHVGGECRESRYPLIPAKDRDPQALGACMTYARRFCYMAILGIAPEDDDGETASGRGKAQGKAQAPSVPSVGHSAAPLPASSTAPGEQPEDTEYTEDVAVYDPNTGEQTGMWPRVTSRQKAQILALLHAVRNTYDEKRFRKDCKRAFLKEVIDDFSSEEAARVINNLTARTEKAAANLAKATETMGQGLAEMHAEDGNG